MERVKGIEPSSSAWEAGALPLCYTRKTSLNITLKLNLSSSSFHFFQKNRAGRNLPAACFFNSSADCFPLLKEKPRFPIRIESGQGKREEKESYSGKFSRRPQISRQSSAGTGQSKKTPALPPGSKDRNPLRSYSFPRSFRTSFGLFAFSMILSMTDLSFRLEETLPRRLRYAS